VAERLDNPGLRAEALLLEAACARHARDLRQADALARKGHELLVELGHVVTALEGDREAKLADRPRDVAGQKTVVDLTATLPMVPGACEDAGDTTLDPLPRREPA
jgi:hypothetical protein